MPNTKKTVKTVKPQKIKKTAVKQTKTKNLTLKKVTIKQHNGLFVIEIGGKLQTNKSGTENTCKGFKTAIKKNMKNQIEIYKAQNRTLAEAIQFTNEQYK